MTNTNSHGTSIPRSLFIFSLVYGGLCVLAGIIGTKIVGIGPFFGIGPLVVEAGIFAFLQLVVLSSAVSELHGQKTATQLVRFGFIPLVLSAAMIWMVIAMPAADFWKDQESFQKILGQGSRMMLAGLISYGISQTLNIALFERLKKGTGSFVWLRGGIAAVASQIVDTTLFITIAFYGKEGYDLAAMLYSGITAKIFLSIVMVPPLIQLAVTLGRKLDGSKV
jgi:queuosine precursor transporter